MNEDMSSLPSQDLPFSRTIHIAQVSAGGCKGEIILDGEQCARLAALLDVRSLERFTFKYELSDIGRGRFRLTGSLKAAVQQDCIITLEPIANEIEDEIEVELWPAKDVALAEKLAQDEGHSIMIDGPEPIEGDSIDIAQLAYEQIASVIDPYPRKKNAQFQWSADTNESDKPFASLGQLMRNKIK